MKTTCVLSESDIKNLYVAAGAGMNEALLKGAVFSPSDFMQIVFDKFNKKMILLLVLFLFNNYLVL